MYVAKCESMITSNCRLSTLWLTSTEKLVKCLVLHNTGGLGSLSCTIPSLDHPPIVWLLQNISTSLHEKIITVYVCMHVYFSSFKEKSQNTQSVVTTSPE